MSFVKRVIEVTLTLGTGDFGNGLGSSVTLSGYRVRCDCQIYGGDAGAAVQLRISGVTLPLINQLTCLGQILGQYKGGNTVRVAVGNSGSALTTIFTGSIITAWGDFASPPDSALNITAIAYLWHAVLPVNATSFPGTTSINTIFQAIVAGMNNAVPSLNLTYSNPQNIATTLTNMYLPGSGLDQIRECAAAAGVNYKIELGVLTIWPVKGFIPNIGLIPIISPSNGLVSYPTFSQQGVDIKTVFLPNLSQGNRFTVTDSALTLANNTWTIASAVHTLESETPGGAWFTVLKGIWVG
jgi:hypothetical protein